MKPASRSCSSTDLRIAIPIAVLGLVAFLVTEQTASAGGSAPKSSGSRPEQATTQMRTGSVELLLGGVWQAKDGGRMFFGPLDPVTKIGAYTVWGARDKKYTHTYQIRQSDEVSRTAAIEIFFDDRKMPPTVQEFTFSADGKTAQRRLTGTGFSLMQFIRLEGSGSDTLIYVSAAP